MTHHQRIAVRRRFGADIESNGAARATAIFDHDRLTDAGSKLLRHQPRDQIVGAARREGYDDADGFRRVSLP